MDIVIVLGCSKNLDGTKGSPKGSEYTNKSHAYGRLKKASEVFVGLLENKNKIIVCSGGFRQAKKMKKFLIGEGIDENNILIEPYSRNTIENCIFTYELINKIYLNLEKNVKATIHLVTDDYHIKRSENIFQFFKKRLLFPSKIKTHKSLMIDYLDNVSDSEKNKIEEYYLHDSMILNNMENSLKLYEDWHPNAKDYSEREVKK